MSVNITVNGKFSRHSQLLNPEGYQKHLENERRKLRLQQVRAQSKELARKIRTDVSEEKQRQLRNLEAVKAQELNLWRKNIVAQKRTDYRKAMKQVGSAHLAAKKEKEFAKEKRESRTPPNKRIPMGGEKKGEKAENREKYNVNEPKEKGGRCQKKVNVYFDDNCEVLCLTDTDSEEEYNEYKFIEITDIEITDSSSSSDFSLETRSEKDSKSTQTGSSKEILLKRAPPVVLGVDVEPIHSEVVVAPAHIVDKHVETNRQFDSVVNTESTKNTATQTNVTMTSADDKSTHIPENTESTTRPRYTQISDLIANQKRTELDNYPANPLEENVAVTKGASYTVLRHGIAPKDKVTAINTQDSYPESTSEEIATANNADSYTVTRDGLSSKDKFPPFNVQNKYPEPAPEKTTTTKQVASYAVERDGTASQYKAAPFNVQNKYPESRPEQIGVVNKRASVSEVTAQKNKVASLNTQNKYAEHIPKKTAPADKEVSAIASDDIFLKDKMPPLPTQTRPNRSISIQGREKSAYPSRFSQVTRLSSTSGKTTTSSKDTDDNGVGERGSVQFFDYKNKFSKEYNQSPNAMALPQISHAEPNAMEQAELEKQRLSRQEEGMEELRQRSVARGMTALERERVRRDCTDLTQKLDALTQKRQPLLSSDANIHSKTYLAGKVAQKEVKMNNAIEELLSRPVIITCPDRRNDIPKKTNQPPSMSRKHVCSSDLNLGSRLLSGDSENGTCRSTDTNGSGSILLGYIDEQRDQIKSELSQCDDSPRISMEKKEKLTQLLERIEILRKSLLKELNSKPDEESEPIGDAMLSKTKSNNFTRPSKKNPKTREPKAQMQTETLMDRREQELKKREMMLQKELQEVIQTQQKLKTDQAKSATVKIITRKEEVSQRTSVDKPLEIVIKVKGDSKRSKRKSNKMQSKDTVTKENPQPPTSSNQSLAANRRGSYDSNSTAYHSMPPAFNTATEQFVDRVKHLDKNKRQRSTSLEQARSSSNTSVEVHSVEIHKKPRSHINPLISLYVQRLLGMTRESVKALEVSSSEVDSPSSSVVNISTNINSSSDPATMLSEDRLQRVEQFVNENRSFINELEESLRTHSNETLESSLRQFENIWKQKLKQEATTGPSEPAIKGLNLKDSKTQPEKEKPKKSASKIAPKIVQPVPQKPEKPPPKKAQAKSTNLKKSSESVVDKETKNEADAYATQSQLSHYAELTKNCSTRIIELTALITKVRQEKQRILEVTLTSVSDNDRLSTEYADLPGTQNKSDSSVPDSTKKNIAEQVPLSIKETEREPAVAPLEKHKQTGRSRDSGISMPSRPVTALGHDTETEPQSFASSARTITNTITQSSGTYRKPHPPPPTIHRYSPQLPEEDVVHELSTIVEVDTPATSRINTSIQPATSEQHHENENRQPIPFPTFEEYVKELKLDLSMLDPEESMRMEHEYNELIEALKDGKGDKAYSFEEFPTLTSYLKNVTGNDHALNAPETIEDLFGCLRLATIIAKPFPSHREYLERLDDDSIVKFIDSESLENLTDHQSALSETESDTLNIEDELKRRNILKQSFRSSSTKQDIFTTSTDSNDQAKSKSSIGWTRLETGVGRLSSSTTDSASDKFQRELLALGLKWHKSMRSKEKEAAALSSSTSDPPTTNAPKEISKQSPKEKEKKNKSVSEVLSDSEFSERPLNLRDFLTRQLLKHVTATSTCDSSLSGESLRSQFFMAVLDSMTPSGSPRTNTASQSVGQNNLERQKTSTPVRTPAIQSRQINEISKSNETSPSQLFSAESNLSSVQYPEHKRTSKKKKSPKQER